MNPAPESAPLAPPASTRKAGFWTRLGGGPLTIAIILHVVALAVGAFWIAQIIRTPPKGPVDFGTNRRGGEQPAQQAVKTRKPAPLIPNTDLKRVTVDRPATMQLPEQSDKVSEMSPLTSLSDSNMPGGPGPSGRGPDRSGPQMAPGLRSLKTFDVIPLTMRKRCSKDDRLQRLADNGGTKECEEAVLKGLQWLKANQQADGSWSGQSKVAMTGLALLAYFGHCETPASQEFGESCMRGIVYLVNIGAKNNGRIADNFAASNWSYEHAIAAYALAEATTFCNEIKQPVPDLAEVTEKAGQFIIDNQHASGGWSYKYEREGGHPDVSITGWQMQALAACNHAGIKYKGINSCISKALDYVAKCQNKNGEYGYTGPPPNAGAAYSTLTGVGMLCHQMWGKGNASGVSKAARYVLKNTTFDFNNKLNLYAHYYESQAMSQRGGEDWKKYNALFRDELLKNQEQDGSWKVPPGAPHISNNVFSTCLCTLMLEVYYRFLSTGGGGGGGERPGI